jgi:predicted DsbA family dithiol-disulfide isomerase|tara:strand:+ start:654 stop:1199 length:546 start_codon:yes stop_codon:yes gene_type:complete
LANEYEIAVEGKAYLLRPDTPKEGRERPQRPGETEDDLSEPLRGQAKDAGLIMKPSKRTPNTLYALEATEYAQQHGKFMEFHHAAYKAFWEDRQDIGEMEILHKVAHEVGLDADEMVKGLEEKTYAETVMSQYQEALGYGISGIPTFLVGNLLFTGAQPYGTFKMAMERYLTEGVPPAPES